MRILGISDSCPFVNESALVKIMNRVYLYGRNRISCVVATGKSIGDTVERREEDGNRLMLRILYTD